jgi:hypothetical protein
MKDNYVRTVMADPYLSSIVATDGDTIRGMIDWGGKLLMPDQSFRLWGVNAYETTRRGTWDNDLPAAEVTAKIKKGKEAKVILQTKMDAADIVSFQSLYSPSKTVAELRKRKLRGKYGRWLGILWLHMPETDAGPAEVIEWNQWLIDNGYGYEYMRTR